MTIRREGSGSRGRGSRQSQATQTDSVANATGVTTRPVTRGRSKKAENQGRSGCDTVVVSRGEANEETDNTLSGSVGVVVWMDWPGARVRFVSIRVGFY